MKKSLYILAELSDRDFDWLIRSGKKRKLSAGTVLIEEGKTIDALYVILDGTLIVTVEALEGKEVATLTTGEVVGEMSFIDSRPPSATVRSLDETTIWAIPRVQLATKLTHDVAFSSHFYHALAILLSDRLRSTVSRFGHVSEAELGLGNDLNPKVLESLELAKMRLDWLLNRLRALQ